MQMTISNLKITVNKKRIKNLHITVLPPDGLVRISAPLTMSEQAIRLAVISKLAWIRKQQQLFAEQPRQTEREMLYRESHYLWGQRFLLDVENTSGKHSIIKTSPEKLLLKVSDKTSQDNRLKLLDEFYRQEMKDQVPILLDKWQPLLEVEVNDWGIKKMKTKWGSCNIRSKRIWLNLELAQKPLECLEYVLIHELVHLHERHHNERFKAFMDKYLPNWRERQQLLNSLPLSHSYWNH